MNENPTGSALPAALNSSYKKTTTQNNGPDLVITGHHTYAVTEENHDEQEQHVWDY